MKENIWLKELKQNLLRINPSEINLKYYDHITESLSDFNSIDKFYQIRKDTEDEGLAFEVMLFDNKIIHDIVITKTNVNYNSVAINKINMAYLEVKYSEESDENGLQKIIDKLKFTISFGAEGELSYETSTKKFEELLTIKSNLLKIILL